MAAWVNFEIKLQNAQNKIADQRRYEAMQMYQVMLGKWLKQQIENQKNAGK